MAMMQEAGDNKRSLVRSHCLHPSSVAITVIYEEQESIFTVLGVGKSKAWG